MNIVLLGPPGSGKGTVAGALAKEFGFYHISPGQMLREEVRKKTIIGKQIAKYVNKGELVPTQFVVELVKLLIRGKKKVFLDGFPRCLNQAQGIKVDAVLAFEVSEKQVIERLKGRRICREAKHNYHLTYFPPKKKGICDIDGSTLFQRDDDKPSVIRKRFQEYSIDTLPLLQHYESKKIVSIVDASKQPDEVIKQARKVLKKILAQYGR